MRHCLRLFDLLALLLLAYVFYSAFTRIYIPWDSWTYHLPFASYLWGIGGGKNSYATLTYFESIYAGYPLLGEWLQGLLWVVFDDIRATSLINPLALSGFCVAATLWLRTPFFWVIVASLTFPLVAIHSVSTYKDLLVAALVATSMIAAAKIYKEIIKNPEHFLCARSAYAWAIFIGTSLLAANAKVQAWFFVLPHCVLFVFLSIRKISVRKKRAILLTVISVLVIASSYNQIKNYMAFDNPLYPIVLHRDGELGIDSASGSPGYSSNAGTPSYAGTSVFSQPIYFLASLTEIDYTIRHDALRYVIDMFSGTSEVRSGGLWGIYVIFLCALLALFIQKKAFPEHGTERSYVLICFALTTFLCLLMPQSNQLRYVIVWPLMLVVCTGFLVSDMSQKQRALLYCFLTLCFLTSQSLISDRPLFGGWRAPISQQEWRDSGNPAIISRLRDGQKTCLEVAEVQTHLWFRYSAAVIGGTHVIQSPPDFDKTCADLPH